MGAHFLFTQRNPNAFQQIPEVNLTRFIASQGYLLLKWKLGDRRKGENSSERGSHSQRDVLSINESTRAPRPVRMESVEMERAAGVPVEPGSEEIQVDLQATWLLR